MFLEKWIADPHPSLIDYGVTADVKAKAGDNWNLGSQLRGEVKQARLAMLPEWVREKIAVALTPNG
jgi:hypothetical protein